MKLRFGIIGMGGRGLGAFGRILADRDDTEIGALVDPNRTRLSAAAAELGIEVPFYATTAEMLDQEQLDGVIITSPDYTHEANALTAIERRVHVLVDKPLAITAAGCLRIAHAAAAHDVAVAVGFNLRQVPVLQHAKELIDAGEIGELMLIENREFYNGGRTYMSRWNRRYEWSGGLWVHKGSHDFDIFNWWNAKGTPIRVSAFAGVNALRGDRIPFEVAPDKPVGPHCNVCAYRETCPDVYKVGGTSFSAETAKEDGYRKDLCMYTSDKDTHDNGIAIVEFDNNVRASHLECFICNFSDRRYTVVGDRGTLLVSLSNPTEIEVRPRWSDRNQIVKVPPAPEGGHGGSDPRLVQRFIDSIRTGQRHASTVNDGTRSVAVGEAAELSWRNGRMIEIAELVDLQDPVLTAV